MAHECRHTAKQRLQNAKRVLDWGRYAQVA
jgi:hypothetical protein